LSRQYRNLINSNLNTAIFASSLRSEELNLLKQYRFELPEFPKVNLSAQTLSNLAEILNQSRIWESLDLLRNTYVGSLASSMREAIVDSSSNEEVIEKIESLYEEKVASLPQNQFLREFFLNQFFAILFLVISMWFSHYLSQQSSAELRMLFGQAFERLERVEDKLEKTEKSDLEHSEAEEIEIYYIVQRTVSVKSRPEFKSFTIDYLSLDTKVRLIKSKHKWIYIEYIDYLEIIPRYGWVNKKYLNRLEK
jgi:Fe2+ transport system protein B